MAMAKKKPAPRKPAAPRKPSTGARVPMSAPSRNSGLTVVMPNGSTVGLRDLGKVKPTPKPKPKVTPKKTPKMTPQDAASKKIIKDRYGW
jgi:hypothetical protein